MLLVQVAEALPVQSQADVMQRELESCLSLEFTPDSLPPVLHQVDTEQTLLSTKLNIYSEYSNQLVLSLQFFADRSYHLAQTKYLLMLRWRRFCRHTGVIEKLYPHYKVTA